MDLTREDVREVLRVLDSSGLDELHLELPDLTLTVRREGAAGWTAEQQLLRRPAVEGTTEPAAAEPESARAAVAEGLAAVHSPLPGTFYRASKPGAPPFVDIGDTIEGDTIVGLVETMKMMTPVRAGVRGTVMGFPTGNGEFADTAAVLLLVDPASDTAGVGEGAQ